MEKLESHSTLFETEAADLESRERKGGQRSPSSELLAALRAYLLYVGVLNCLVAPNLKCRFYRTLEKVRLILVEHSQRQPNANSLLRNTQDVDVLKGLDGQIDETFKEFMVRAIEINLSSPLH